MNQKRLKIAIQRKGRLSTESLTLLRNCGAGVDQLNNRLIIQSKEFPIDVLYVRDDDIPTYIRDGVCDLGIVGENVVEEFEESESIKKILNLGFGKCRLSIAAPQDSKINILEDLQGRRIATSYPNTLKNFLNSKQISASVTKLEGSVEIAPSLNIADAICDLVSSGSTLKANGLVELVKILQSEAVLITRNSEIDCSTKPLLKKFIDRIKSCLSARNKNYVMMNAPKENLEAIKSVIPGMEDPTVVALTTEDKIAIHAVADEKTIWDTVEKLKELGASSILISPLEKIVL